MKTKLHLFGIAFVCSFSGLNSQTFPAVAENATAGNLNIRSAQPCTTAAIAATLATNSKLVSSSAVLGSCGYNWYEVDIPLTSAPSVSYYGASGANYLVQTTNNYVEVTNNVPNGLRIRETAGGTQLWIGNNYAAIWWIASAPRGQRLAYTGTPVQYIGGDAWIEVHLPYNYCTVGQGGPYTQTGWVSDGFGQPDGPYLYYLPLSIQENNTAHSILLFPNPTSGKFNITSDNTGPLKISIVNLLGKSVYESDIISANTEIDLSNEPRGVYFCRLVSEGIIVETKRIIIQ